MNIPRKFHRDCSSRSWDTVVTRTVQTNKRTQPENTWSLRRQCRMANAQKNFTDKKNYSDSVKIFLKDGSHRRDWTELKWTEPNRQFSVTNKPSNVNEPLNHSRNGVRATWSRWTCGRAWVDRRRCWTSSGCTSSRRRGSSDRRDPTWSRPRSPPTADSGALWWPPASKADLQHTHCRIGKGIVGKCSGVSTEGG